MPWPQERYPVIEPPGTVPGPPAGECLRRREAPLPNYRDDGQQVADRDGVRVLVHRFRLTGQVPC